MWRAALGDALSWIRPAAEGAGYTRRSPPRDRTGPAPRASTAAGPEARKGCAVLGRKDYTREEYDQARAAIDQQRAVYRRLVAAVTRGPEDETVTTAIHRFEMTFFCNLVLVLDRYFVYRLRVVAGKDANPLNEVELISDSLMNNGGVLRVGNVVKWLPEESILKLRAGDRIFLTEADFGRLSDAFFADLERKFLH